jgi:hypothetical protein
MTDNRRVVWGDEPTTGPTEPFAYAGRGTLFYPGRAANPSDVRRLANYEVNLDEIGIDSLIVFMSKQIEANFQMFFSAAEKVVGADRAEAIAEAMGLMYGGSGYERYLSSRGGAAAGSTTTMAGYQDLAHAVRGPKHSEALFCKFNDEYCVVERSGCVYYSEDHPENARYVKAFEDACAQAYIAVDDNLEEVIRVRCRWQGSPTCKVAMRYRTAESDEATSSPGA